MISVLQTTVRLSRLWILLDDRRGAEQGLGWYYRNPKENGNRTSMSSKQMGTWPQLIGYALFEIWSLISCCELKSRKGYSTGRLEVYEVSMENQRMAKGIPEHLGR